MIQNNHMTHSGFGVLLKKEKNKWMELILILLVFHYFTCFQVVFFLFLFHGKKLFCFNLYIVMTSIKSVTYFLRWIVFVACLIEIKKNNAY